MSTPDDAPRGRVTLQRRRLWSLRLTLAAGRWLVYGLAVVGVIVAARTAISPPLDRVTIGAAAPTSDAGAEWFALRFARAYLTWSGDLSSHEQALAAFVGPGVDPDAGLTPALGSSEHLQWLAIAAERREPGGARDFTVAADTGGAAMRYLDVAVARTASGAVVLQRYPALVAAPQPAPAAALDGGGLPVVAGGAVRAVLDRALGNYVDGSVSNLAADLAPSATVDAASPGLALRSVVRLVVEPSGSVLATVVAVDSAGTAYTLAYTVSVAQISGRWEIERIAS
jgi:Conjugative transposon protein TcpC